MQDNLDLQVPGFLSATKFFYELFCKLPIEKQLFSHQLQRFPIQVVLSLRYNMPHPENVEDPCSMPQMKGVERELLKRYSSTPKVQLEHLSGRRLTNRLRDFQRNPDILCELILANFVRVYANSRLQNRVQVKIRLESLEASRYSFCRS